MSEQTRDLIEVLEHDHREVEQLFRDIESATDAQQRRDLADQMTAELVRHSVAEEAYLYPTIAQALPDGERLSEKEIEEHGEVEQALKRLEGLDGDDAEFMPVFETIRDDVISHVQEEENVLFTGLREHCSREELLDLGGKVMKAKKLAPTRPHPSAPDHPPLNKLLAPGAGLVDRLRDHLSGRST